MDRGGDDIMMTMARSEGERHLRHVARRRYREEPMCRLPAKGHDGGITVLKLCLDRPVT
jgi:hypothetical protein